MGRCCVVVFSGGQDSTTCLGWARQRFSRVVALSFFYGQKHEVELEQAKKITEAMDIEHHVVNVDFLPELVESALTSNGDVTVFHAQNPNLPASFVPNRNALFLTLAHAFAQKIGASTVVTGVCETDYSGYPDCRAEFVEQINNALNVGSLQHIKIETPLMWLSKAQTFALAESCGCLDEVIQLSHTCYNGDRQTIHEWGAGCGECPACQIRERGWLSYIRMPIYERAELKKIPYTGEHPMLVTYTFNELQTVCPENGEGDLFSVRVEYIADEFTLEIHSMREFFMSLSSRVYQEELHSIIFKKFEDALGKDASLAIKLVDLKDNHKDQMNTLISRGWK